MLLGTKTKAGDGIVIQSFDGQRLPRSFTGAGFCALSWVGHEKESTDAFVGVEAEGRAVQCHGGIIALHVAYVCQQMKEDMSDGVFLLIIKTMEKRMYKKQERVRNNPNCRMVDISDG